MCLRFIIPHYKRSSCLPFSWTETDFPSLETDSLRSQTPKRHSCDPQKAMWFCMKQRISSLDRDMHHCYARRTSTNMTSRQAARSHAKFLTMPLLLPVLSKCFLITFPARKQLGTFNNPFWHYQYNGSRSLH